MAVLCRIRCSLTMRRRSCNSALSVPIPALLGHGFGAFTRPADCGFCFFWTPPPTSTLGPHSRKRQPCLGSLAHSLGSALCAPSHSGDQRNGVTAIFENVQRIIGFTGKNAEARTTQTGRKYTVLSVATKSSYKDKTTEQYISHTEWHRCTVWGKLGEWAQQLKKGAHVQIKGEPRSREYPDKKYPEVKHKIWEIRVHSILKLDRAEKAADEDVSDAVEPDEPVSEVSGDVPF